MATATTCSKRVHVEFTSLQDGGGPGIAVRVRDEGCGFDPSTLADPLAPENLLKANGRGIFLMRSFMDEMTFRRAEQGGMEVRMVKRVPQSDALPDPLYLATAVEIVLRAGDIQRAGQESGFRVDKKGSIDLVTEVDLACERMCRETLAERFPEHDISAEELGGSPTGPAASRFRWVFDPLDGTTNYAHGLPIYCSSLALEIDGRAEVAAIYDPTRKELFTAERGEGAYLNGQALRVSQTDNADRLASGHRLSL